MANKRWLKVPVFAAFVAVSALSLSAWGEGLCQCQNKRDAAWSDAACGAPPGDCSTYEACPGGEGCVVDLCTGYDYCSLANATRQCLLWENGTLAPAPNPNGCCTGGRAAVPNVATGRTVSVGVATLTGSCFIFMPVPGSSN
jgi:hypothetical protein